jgi:hypothetical protein
MRGRSGNAAWNQQPGRAVRRPEESADARVDLEALLRPSWAFEHPSAVASDPDLTVNEKRAILASWASDACAVEAMPTLRHPPGGATVRFDEIMEALQKLDSEAREQFGRDLPPVRKRPARWATRRGSPGDGKGRPLR